MKRWIAVGALAIVLLVAFMAFSPNTGADVGDFNDYGGGGGGWDSGGGYDGGSYDYGGSSWDSGSGSSGGDLSVGSIVIIIVVMVVVAVLKNKVRGAGRQYGSTPQWQQQMPSAGPSVKDHTNQIVPAIMQIDPQFSNDKFIAWAKEVFFTLQYAWMARDWERVRPFEKEELYKQHEMQIRQYIENGRINVLERININQAYLQKYVRDSEYEYLTVFFQVRMTDYIKDERTGQVLKGSPNVDSHMKYLYTFMRKSGVKTNPASSNMSTTNCPNCGAPTKITSAGRCEYCDSVITTGAFDWVLSNIDGVKSHTVIDDSGVVIRD